MFPAEKIGGQLANLQPFHNVIRPLHKCDKRMDISYAYKSDWRFIMLIIRRDLETILKVMDRFDMDEQWHGVDLQYQDNGDGYELKIEFGHYVHDIICRVSVVIDQDTLPEKESE